MSVETFDVDQIKVILAEAQAKAKEATAKYYNTVLNGKDQYPCGFAWVNIYVKGNTKLGRALKEAGIKRSDYEKAFQLYNPSGHPCQNMDAKEAGAIAAANVFTAHGFKAYAASRMD